MRDGITRSTARVAMLAVAMLIVAGTAARADIVLGLEGYWKLDQLFDSNLDVVEMTDSHHAEINSSFSSPTSVAGKLDKGFDYEASDTTVVDAGNGLQLNSVNTATFAAWIKPESFRGNTGAISRNGIIGDNLNNVIFMLTDQGRLALTWDAGVDDYHGLQADAGDALEAGAFYHVAATRNGANIDLYINGVKVKSAANQPTGNFAAFGHIQLGRVNGTTGRDFDGVIDDVRVYSRELSSEEIEQLAAARQVTLNASDDAKVGEGAAADTNFGTTWDIRVGPASGDEFQGFIKFDLSGIPANAQILNATLQGIQTDTYIGADFSVYEVTDDWNEGSVTWNTQPATAASALGTMSINGSGTLGGFSFLSLNSDLTNLVAAWASGSKTNYGLNLRGFGDTLRSKDGGIGPQLAVEYVATAVPEPTGVVLLVLGGLSLVMVRTATRGAGRE